MAISATEARRNLLPLLEQVVDDRTPVEIASPRRNAHLVAAEDYDALKRGPMTSTHDEYRRFPDLPGDWKVGEYADGDLFADLEGSRRIEDRDRRRLPQRQAEIAAERAQRR